MSTVSYERYNPKLYDFPASPAAKNSRRPDYRRMNQPQKKKVKRGREFTTRTFLTLLIVILSAALLLEILFHFVISPRLSIDHVRLDPGRGLRVSEESILETAGISGKIHYFNIDPKVIEERLSALPYVRRVEVERVFPDTLTISLVQRQPVAVAVIDTGTTVVPALIDREGVMFALGASQIEGLPVISGIRFEDPKPGMMLPQVLVQFLKDIERIKQTSPVLLTLISEFKFIKKDGSRYEVLLYPEHYRVPVRIGSRLDERTLNYVMMVLDVVLRQGLTADLEEIDFRSGDVVFRTREG